MTQIAYASDEDIALRAPSDYTLLCPYDQKVVAGVDGLFTADDPWTLQSASVNFALQGLVPGHIVQLTRPVAVFRAPGEMFAVESVKNGSVTLRRKGQISGSGQPPCSHPPCSNVEFLVTTFAPQLQRVSYELSKRYGIDDLVSGRRTSDLYDPREVREAVVLSVLHARYLDQSREAGNNPDIFAQKSRLILAELDDLLARAVLNWLPSGIPTTRFSTRITR